MPTIEQTLQRINRILDVRAGMTNSMIPAIKRDNLPEMANRIEGILARIIRQDSKAQLHKMR
jgi:hypothetical protein